MAKNDTTQTQTQQSVSNPWEPAQPMLRNILNTLGSSDINVSPLQAAAANNLTTAAGTIPNFGAQGTGAVNEAFDLSTQPQMGMLNKAYADYTSRLSPIANGAMLDPMSNPALRGALDTIQNDVTNQVNSEFAGAGRSLSGMNQQALARGIAQGEAPVIAGQYNTNVGNMLTAAGNLFGAGGSTAGGLTQQQLAQLGANTGGIQAAGSIPGLMLAPATTQLGAATTQQQLPFQNLMLPTTLTSGIAGLGGQSNTTGTVTQHNPMLPTLLGGAMGGLGLLGGMGAFGSSGWMNPSSASWMFSDENLKDDIKPIGMLYDATPVYSFTYKDDPSDTPRIGVMAQDVEQTDPAAVREVDGWKAVDYGRVADRAAFHGMLHGMMRPHHAHA